MDIIVNDKKIQPCNDCVFSSRCKGADSETCIWSVLHYIVKDYKYMRCKYLEIEPTLKKRKEQFQKYRNRVIELTHELQQKQVNAITDEKLRELTNRLIASVNKRAEENEKLRAEIELLYKQVEDTKNSRNAVVEAVTDDLEQKLKVANQRIELLAKAVADPNAANSAFVENCKVNTIETEAEKQWMTGAMQQLDKAARKLLSVEEKLNTCDTILREAENTQEIDRMLKVINRLSSKLEATLSHIECFFDKVGDIKVVNNEANKNVNVSTVDD